MSTLIESAEYNIVSARHEKDIYPVISLEKGIPRGNLVVERLIDNSVLYQKWDVVHQSDGIYTFKSRIEKFEGEPILDAERPYARNTEVRATDEDFSLDPYLRAGIIDLFATFRIRRVKQLPNEPEAYTIGLPERLTVWTIVDGGVNIILEKFDPEKPKLSQLWRFERTGDLKPLSRSQSE